MYQKGREVFKMISVENIQKEEILTVENLCEGDTFIILAKYFDNPFIMTDTDFFVDLIDGTTYNTDQYCNRPVRKIDFKLVQK